MKKILDFPMWSQTLYDIDIIHLLQGSFLRISQEHAGTWKQKTKPVQSNNISLLLYITVNSRSNIEKKIKTRARLGYGLCEMNSAAHS